MTKVGFYVVRSGAPDARLAVAARLVEKAFRRGHRIFINSCDEQQASELDELLWSYRAASFLPHGLVDATDADGIAIGWGQQPGDHDDMLINLQLVIPVFFSRFQRVAEVVSQDQTSLIALRKSWLYYRERGYPLEKYEL